MNLTRTRRYLRESGISNKLEALIDAMDQSNELIEGQIEDRLKDSERNGVITVDENIAEKVVAEPIMRLLIAAINKHAPTVVLDTIVDIKSISYCEERLAKLKREAEGRQKAADTLRKPDEPIF
jgi:hypothetical protein